MKKSKALTTKWAVAILCCVCISCAKNDSGIPATTPTPTPVPTPLPVATLLQLPAGWKLSTALNATMPTGIQVYQFDTIFLGKTVKAWCVAFDTKNANLELKPLLATTAKKTSDFYNQEQGTKYVAINGGFFGSNQSFSLVKYNNTVQAANIKAVTRTFNGVGTSYFPTRVAYGINSTGDASVHWIYHVGSGNDLIYKYPSPSPNVEGAAPQPVPTATFLTGGSIWETTTAIGGSPMLVYNGAINITADAELLSVNNTTSRPRSGMGYTSNNISVMIAVEGDNAPTYPGINLNEFANMLQSLGCTNAINLDGGGSTSLVINGNLTVRPGDAGVERPVISAVLLKRK